MPENHFLLIVVPAWHQSTPFSAEKFIQEEKVEKVTSVRAGMAFPVFSLIAY